MTERVMKPLIVLLHLLKLEGVVKQQSQITLQKRYIQNSQKEAMNFFANTPMHLTNYNY